MTRSPLSPVPSDSAGRRPALPTIPRRAWTLLGIVGAASAMLVLSACAANPSGSSRGAGQPAPAKSGGSGGGMACGAGKCG